MKFDNTNVFGWKMAILGMRNALMSREKSDSVFEIEKLGMLPMIGNADMKLIQNLVTAGSGHDKVLRFIHVQADVYAPRYLWSEFDTYHWCEKNSESTMHRLLNNRNPITLDMFDFDDSQLVIMRPVIEELEQLRLEYLATTNIDARNRLLTLAKKILPESFIQMRTIDTNYSTLRTMYKQRHNHRLAEWNTDFVEWLETLPYSKELIML